MQKLHRNYAGFGVHELILVLLVIGALFGVGGYVWSKNSTQRTSSTTKVSPSLQKEVETPPQPAAPDPFEGWRTYENAELGFKLRYPQEWGTPSVARKALNDAKYETNLPYVVTFSGDETPFARIFPSDWKFTPPKSTEWRGPLAREDIKAYQVKLVDEQTRAAAITYSSFSGEVSLAGIKLIALSKLNASQIEVHKDDSYDAKRPCLSEQKNKYGSMEIMATLDCYPEAYRNNFVKFMDSFTAL